MAEINWTRESEIWLEDIYEYIAADDPEAAERTVSLIYEKAQLRILLYEHYRIAYLVKPVENIEILGVFHGALDIDRYFI